MRLGYRLQISKAWSQLCWTASFKYSPGHSLLQNLGILLKQFSDFYVTFILFQIQRTSSLYNQIRKSVFPFLLLTHWSIASKKISVHSKPSWSPKISFFWKWKTKIFDEKNFIYKIYKIGIRRISFFFILYWKMCSFSNHSKWIPF